MIMSESMAPAKDHRNNANEKIPDAHGSLIGEWSSVNNPQIIVKKIDLRYYASFNVDCFSFTKIKFKDCEILLNGYRIKEHQHDKVKWHRPKSDWMPEEALLWNRGFRTEETHE